jgi:hypothetical protein
MQFTQRHNILQYPEYWFQIDEYRSEDGQQVLFAHLRFDEFNKSILSRAWKEWKLFRQLTDVPVFAYSEDPSEKFHAFVTMFGFKPTGQEIVCNNGERRRLYVSIKDLPHVRPEFNNSEQEYHEPDRPVGSSAGAASEHRPA